MIRWISPRLGTAPFEEGVGNAGVVLVDVRNLVDRAGNDAATIRGHVDAALSALRRGDRVLVCCDHGISRSNAVATAVLAAEQGTSFDAALITVLATTPSPEIRVEVLAEVRAACGEPPAAPDAPPNRILLTGGHGRLGRLLRRTRPSGIELWAPTRDELDLLDGPAPIDAFLRRHGIGRVAHFAQPHATNLGRSLGDALAMLRNVLDATATRSGTLFFPSTWLVFAGHEAHELHATEATPVRPATCLGDTKALCEQLIAHFVQRHGLAGTVLRSGPVLGPGIAPAFVRNLRQQAAAGTAMDTHRYDNGRPALDFVPADDYAAAVWGLIQAGRTGTFHVGGGALTSTRRMAELIGAALGSASPLSETRVNGATCNVQLDPSRLEQAIGWRPTTAVHEALLRFAQDPSPPADTQTLQEPKA
ncbi:NAD-dependent epimerase/dehydratase family protein [Arenimonas terrae]|uniref:NAD-dependent epimerase/dehydratase family protein n=1 Tax=Arenimonas terrae TaxID=2546226 RepID=UPI00159EEEAC|nr:NAD-dependent epimerase/dehydratase family protein [Arenimonas terrae]